MFQRRIYASVLKHTFQSMCEIDITDKISRKRKIHLYRYTAEIKKCK